MIVCRFVIAILNQIFAEIVVGLQRDIFCAVLITVELCVSSTVRNPEGVDIVGLAEITDKLSVSAAVSTFSYPCEADKINMFISFCLKAIQYLLHIPVHSSGLISRFAHIEIFSIYFSPIGRPAVNTGDRDNGFGREIRIL